MKTTDSKNRINYKKAICGYLFASPWIIGFFLFTLYPMLSSLYYSFTNYNLSQAPEWIGLTNYKIIFRSDKLIPIAVHNTLYYAILSVPLNMILGILIALLMNRKIRGINLLRTVYYLPNIVSVVAASLLWQFIFQGSGGLLNSFLGLFGIQGQIGYMIPNFSKISLIVMNSWYSGSVMIIYLAGLQGIPRAYYEAAEIDGASNIRQLFSITLPLLSPSIFFNLIISIINALQTFSSAFIMTDGTGQFNNLLYACSLQKSFFGYAYGLCVCNGVVAAYSNGVDYILTV